jgi:signal transduction histidine kinase
MMTPPTPANEQERLLELYKLDILDTEHEAEYDEIVQLASSICQVPISLISLVDVNRQWFKAKVGLDAFETSREVSFCAHMLSEDIDALEVTDAEKDARFFDNPLVTTNPPNIRFYAGVPLITSNGYKLGSLCVIDRKPNHLTSEQSYALKVLSNQIIRMLELRVMNKEIAQQKKVIEQQNFIQKRMLSIIAHDVRSPLNSLIQVMQMDDLNELTPQEKTTVYAELKNQVASTLGLLNNLVDWGSEQIIGETAKSKPIELQSFITEKLQSYQLTASLKNNTLKNLVDCKVVLTTNQNMLDFLIRNFVANAIKFTQNGIISVDACANDAHLTLAISDTGMGMSQDKINTILDRKIVKSTYGTNNEIGSGLGLMLAQDFIAALGGTLQIESEMGKGTTIKVCLPNN